MTNQDDQQNGLKIPQILNIILEPIQKNGTKVLAAEEVICLCRIEVPDRLNGRCPRLPIGKGKCFFLVNGYYF